MKIVVLTSETPAFASLYDELIEESSTLKSICQLEHNARDLLAI